MSVHTESIWEKQKGWEILFQNNKSQNSDDSQKSGIPEREKIL